MKASELIKELQYLVEKHGDNKITFAAEREPSHGYNSECEIACVAVLESEEKNTSFLICDAETLISLID